MTTPLLAVFDVKKEEADHFSALWRPLDEQIYNELRAVYQSRPDDPLFQSALQRLDTKRLDMTQTLEKALARLLDSLYHPELVLATTGTTSSGKSALVNLLCGAEIMPVAFDEMSAGVVSIRHGPGRTLTIHETPGAVWEQGSWSGLSDDEICERLRGVMRAYHRRRDELAEHPDAQTTTPACPCSDLEYPTRIGNHPELLDLPKCCRFRILDLPGLKYVGDDSNSQVIRESREALCFVTYNSFEMDPVVQARLLEQVVDQVKELGGSPARMLFILNRIDGLRIDDREWPGNEEAFVERMTQEIRKTLAARLPEYADVIPEVRVVRLSTLPALYALHLQAENHPERLRAAQAVSGHFNSLIPDQVKEDLPCLPQRWASHHCQRVGEAVWKAAYADAFFTELRDHIHAHFPDLVIPQITDRFKAEAGAQVAEWVVQTASAELKGALETYEAECGRINAARTELEHLCEDSERQLQEPFARIQKMPADSKAETRDLFDTIRDTLKKILEQPPFKRLPQESLKSLEPLCAWQVELAFKRNLTIEAIACILQGRDPPVDVIESLPPRAVHDWHMAIRKLTNSGYTAKVARHGEHVETRDEDKKRKLRDLNQALNDLARVLSPLLQLAMERAADREKDRVLEAMRQLIDIHWKDVTERAQAKIEKLGLNVNLTVPAVNLKKNQQSLTLAYEFVAKIPIDTVVRPEDTGKLETMSDGTERRWYTLWLIEHSKYRTRPVVEDRAYYSADVPSAEKLLKVWDRHAQEQDPTLVRQFLAWMLGQFDQAAESLKESQQELLNRYQAKLDEAHAVAERGHIANQKVWSGILKQAKELHQCLERLCRPPSREGR